MKSLFKKFGVLLILLTQLVWMTSCGDNDNSQITNRNFEARESFSFEVAVENRSRLRLQAINGEITITGLPGANSVIITGEKRVESDSTEDAEAYLPELEVNVQSLTDEVLVETIQPQETQGRNYIVDYTITLPNNLAAQVDHVNGIVTIDSITNSVSVTTVNGDVSLHNIVGSTFVEIINGPIDSEVTLPLDGTIDMRTMNGTIELDIPQSTSAEFSANVTNGNISVANLVLQNEVRTSTSLRGTLGNGQGTISLETINGNIRVSGF